MLYIPIYIYIYIPLYTYIHTQCTYKTIGACVRVCACARVCLCVCVSMSVLVWVIKCVFQFKYRYGHMNTWTHGYSMISHPSLFVYACLSECVSQCECECVEHSLSSTIDGTVYDSHRLQTRNIQYVRHWPTYTRIGPTNGRCSTVFDPLTYFECRIRGGTVRTFCRPPVCRVSGESVHCRPELGPLDAQSPAHEWWSLKFVNFLGSKRALFLLGYCCKLAFWYIS